jgi:hypothetical protein
MEPLVHYIQRVTNEFDPLRGLRIMTTESLVECGEFARTLIAPGSLIDQRLANAINSIRECSESVQLALISRVEEWELRLIRDALNSVNLMLENLLIQIIE